MLDMGDSYIRQVVVVVIVIANLKCNHYKGVVGLQCGYYMAKESCEQRTGWDVGNYLLINIFYLTLLYIKLL